MSEEIKTTFWQKVKYTFSSQNISKIGKVTRNVALVVAGVGGLLISPVCPITIPATVGWWIGVVTIISGSIAGVAQADTSKNGKSGIVSTITNILTKK